MFKTHLALGFLIALFSLSILHPAYPFIFIPLVTILSALPDVDTEKSKFGRKIYPISWCIRIVFGHRGFFHSIFPPVILYFVLKYFHLQFLGLAVVIGYVAHLIGDACTSEGVAFLYPFSKKRISGFMRTGGFAESFVLVALILVDIYISLKKVNLL